MSIQAENAQFERRGRDALNSRPRKAILTFASAACGAGFAANTAHAEQAVQLGAIYTGDVMSSWSDTINGRARYLDSTSFTLDLNLAELTGLSGGPILHADVNITSGVSANDDIGTLQGVDNIESGRERTRIYELWAEQGFFNGKFSARRLSGNQFGIQRHRFRRDVAEFVVRPHAGIVRDRIEWPVNLSLNGAEPASSRGRK